MRVIDTIKLACGKKLILTQIKNKSQLKIPDEKEPEPPHVLRRKHQRMSARSLGRKCLLNIPGGEGYVIIHFGVWF